MAQFVNIYDVDLMKPSAPRQLQQMVCEGDAKGNRVGANVYSDGSPVSLGGQCVGKVVRADGTTVPLTGTVSGNQAYVVLDQASCAIEGQIQVAVCWVSGTNITTLVVAYGTVVSTQTGTAVQPSTPIPDLTQLLAEIDNMRTATAAANAAAEGALANFAPAFSESAAYTAGQYVTYTDGKLYKFTADHAAGVWNSAQVQAVTAGGEFGAVQSQIISIFDGSTLFEGLNQAIDWQAGYIDNQGVPHPGVQSGSNYYCYTSLIDCEYDVKIAATGGYKVRYFVYDKATGAYSSAIGNQDIPYSVTLNDTTKSYRVAWLLKSGATRAEAETAITQIDEYITIAARITAPALTSENLSEHGMATKEYVNDALGIPGWHIGYVWPDDGTPYPDTPTGGNYHVYSDLVSTEYGLVFTCPNRRARRFIYAKDGTYITGNNWQKPPVTFEMSAEYSYRFQVLGGTMAQAQEVLNNIDDYVTIKQLTAADVGWIEFLPITDVYIGDVQQRIYFNELARYDENDGYFVVSASGATYPEVTYTDRYIEFNATSAKTVELSISYYVRDVLSATKTLTAHCKTASFAAKKVMFLGDSYTQNGGMVKWFADHNSNVTLYGTRETTIDGVTYRHEGRGGWTAGNYLNNASVGGVTNPFYNPTTQTFDFAYYMANAGSAYTDVDIVNILLGRNSGFPLSNMDSLDTIVASIKAYRSSIMVVLMCDNNLAADNTGAGAYMQNVHTANRQSHIYNAAFYERYKDSASVVMCFANLNLDNVYDYQTEEVDASITNSVKVKRYVDNVHPWNIPGLGKFGIALNGLLRNILNA